MKTRLNIASDSRRKYAPFVFGASVMRRNTHNLQRRERKERRNRNAQHSRTKAIPILNIPQMTDERWNELTELKPSTR